MDCNLMVLPSKKLEKIRVVRIPTDMDRKEAYRYATGVIAEAEDCAPDCNWDDIEDALNGHGFETLDFILGPSLDK